MVKVLRNDRLDRRFRRSGFARAGSISPSDLADLRAIAADAFRGTRHGFTSSTESHDVEYRETLFERVAPIGQRLVDDLLIGYEVLNVGLLVKFPDQDSTMGPHQDWTVVDENLHRSLNLWIPLVDVDDRNGALAVLPGSHRVLVRPRCSPGLPLGGRDPLGDLAIDDMTAIAMSAGDVLVTDHAVAHASRANTTDSPRAVIAIAAVPVGAPLFHDYRRPDDRVERFEVPDRAWFRSFHMSERPARARPMGIVPYPPDLPVTGLLRSCRHATRPWRSSATPVPAPAPELSVASAGDRACMLRDPEQQAHLDEHGYVVVDLLRPDQVAEVKRAYDLLDHDMEWDSPFADGFHTTLYDNRLEYRRAVLDTIEHAFADGMRRHFDDYGVLFANFPVKRAGGAAVPKHLDWTFVDESRCSSATVWCALDDLDDESGTLGVVPGSHLGVSFVRPVNHRDFAAHEAAARFAEGVVVPLRAGQAVVMDNRTVHFSTPNRTGRVRVAAAAVVAPRTSEPLHYWLDESGLCELVVSRDFYLRYRIGEDPRTVEGVVEVRDASQLTYA